MSRVGGDIMLIDNSARQNIYCDNVAKKYYVCTSRKDLRGRDAEGDYSMFLRSTARHYYKKERIYTTVFSEYNIWQFHYAL